MDGVTDLVIAPFREIVEKGNTAIENAGDNEVMQKAAVNLVKDGEKALKRIEPLCQKHVDEYGLNFVNAIKENEEIATHREELETLVWELDDYLEADNFEEAKFTELRTASRNAALKIGSIIVRMRLESSAAKPLHIQTVLSPPSSPHPPSVLPYPTDTSSQPQSPHPNQMPSPTAGVEVATQQLSLLHDQERTFTEEPAVMPIAAPPVAPPPPPPTFDPWETTQMPKIDTTQNSDTSTVRRSPVADIVSPMRLSTSGPHTSTFEEYYQRRGTIPGNYSDRDSGSSQGRRFSTSQHISPSNSNNAAGWWGPQIRQGSIAEEPLRHRDGLGVAFSPDDVGADHERHVSVDSRLSNNENSDTGTQPFLVRTNSQESLVDPQLKGAIVRDQPAVHLTPARDIQPIAITPMARGYVLDDDPIPVEQSSGPVSPVATLPPKSCIVGQGSSFHLLHGFCPGGKEVINGRIGVKNIRRPVGMTGSTTVARCVSCSFELSFSDISNDVNRTDAGNLLISGVKFRMRFLQKSHVVMKRSDDQLFACLFCIEVGRTLDPSDATVFFTRAALFRHLSRHPRPLPAVAGVCVVDQVDVPEELQNDYDLHFTNPPVLHPALDSASEIAHLPTAVAKEHVRRTVGLRYPPDRGPTHELINGAKLTGVTWPSSYGGEWCMAWHDGSYAAIPFNCTRLDPPRREDVKLGGASLVRAKAKWKFSVRDKDKNAADWLKFDKNEIITNIRWAYSDHWCWSGTNAKGKWGIFPQCFIDTNTVQELSAAGNDRANDLNNELRSTSILPRFSLRKNQGPPSITGSTSSSEAAPRSGFTSAYLNTRRNSKSSGAGV